MTVDTNKEKVEELLMRGVEEIIGEEKLRNDLILGKQLRIKLGIDPTSPNIHIGRAVTLLKLRDFQQLGHKIVFIVGDFTGLIGDTSDKESERPMLATEQVEKNKQTYLEQVGKLLNIDEVEIHYNSEWLLPLTYKEIGEHADQFSVADFIARDNIKRRLDAGKRVSLREILYPLLQGYDSVAVKADVELGGTDQRFNLLAGRKLQEHFKQTPQSIVIGPLVEGLDGRKMSSSWGNTINLTDEPADMYGKVMSLNDELVMTYLTVCTRVPLNEIETLKREDVHPRDLKMRLAREIVALYHGPDDARQAEEQFVQTFQKGAVPEEVEEIEVQPNTLLIDVLVEHGTVSSKSEFRRLISEGAIRNAQTGDAISDPSMPAGTGIVKIGKRRFVKILTK